MSSFLQSYLDRTTPSGCRRKLDTLVENRQVFTLDTAELSVYETLQPAWKVSLQFGDPVLASMIEGKKVMHLSGSDPFDFFPSESVVVPANGVMQIDFPEADFARPTRCLALAISPDLIRETICQMDEQVPKAETGDHWKLNDQNFHFTNDKGIMNTLSRLMYLFMENHLSKKIFANNTLQELVVRMMQTQARRVLIDQCKQHEAQHRLAFAVSYIRENLHEPLHIKTVADKACMSKSHFFRSFRQEFGLSPTDFIQQERVSRAQELLRATHRPINQIGYDCGFNSPSYFVRAFKAVVGKTPNEFRQQWQNEPQNPSKFRLYTAESTEPIQRIKYS